MKNLFLVALVLFAGYEGWQRYRSGFGIEPLMEEPYIAVYGRDSCGYTQKALVELSQGNINIKYFKVDEREVADLLHSRMEASNISTRRYNLPVVDVNGKVYVRPDAKEVLANYNEKL